MWLGARNATFAIGVQQKLQINVVVSNSVSGTDIFVDNAFVQNENC